MKRTNDHINNSNNGGNGNNDLNKKVKLSGRSDMMINASSSMMSDPYSGMYMAGIDANGMVVMNPSFSGGSAGPMMVPGAMTEPNRTIYLGGISKAISAREIFDLVKTGNVESLRMLPEKGCAFLCFVDPMGAEMFYQNSKIQPVQIHGMEIKVGWGKPHPVNYSMQHAIQNGATRNVFINRLDPTMDTDYFMSTLNRFGEIEMIKILSEKNIAFISFTSISSALNCVNTLSNDPIWKGRRISYGKDRCNVQWNQQQNQQFNPGQFQFGLGNYGGQNQFGGMAPGMSQSPNVDRTVYIGNLKATDTCEDICSAIRGGQIYQIRLLKDKCTAFVTFVDPYSATLLHAHGNTIGLAVNGRRIKVGWGKPSSIPFSTMAAILNGATRNIYLGAVEEPIPEEQIRQDFSKYGELEMVKHIPDKKCYFINFTNVNSAMKARKEIPLNPTYSKLNVNYGKDRCAKPFNISDAKLQKMQRRQESGEQLDQQQQAKKKEQPKPKTIRPKHKDFVLPLN